MAGKVFIVLADDNDPRVPRRILDAYPEAYPFSETVHLISANTTASAVARRLQLDGKDEDGTPAAGLVMTMNEDYAGFSNPALWEWFRTARGD